MNGHEVKVNIKKISKFTLFGESHSVVSVSDLYIDIVDENFMYVVS